MAHRAKIIERIHSHKEVTANNPDNIKFRCSFNNDEYEDIITYNDIITHIEDDTPGEGIWRFRSIIAHEGPLTTNDHNYKGSSYNVMVKWETGEITSEPLGIIATDDPVTYAVRDSNA